MCIIYRIYRMCIIYRIYSMYRVYGMYMINTDGLCVCDNLESTKAFVFVCFCLFIVHKYEGGMVEASLLQLSISPDAESADPVSKLSSQL